MREKIKITPVYQKTQITKYRVVFFPQAQPTHKPPVRWWPEPRAWHNRTWPTYAWPASRATRGPVTGASTAVATTYNNPAGDRWTLRWLDCCRPPIKTVSDAHFGARHWYMVYMVTGWGVDDIRTTTSLPSPGSSVSRFTVPLHISSSSSRMENILLEKP